MAPLALVASIVLAISLTTATPNRALAQPMVPQSPIPVPPGTNILFIYPAVYNNFGNFNTTVSLGPISRSITFSKSNLDAFGTAVRYIRFFDISGATVGIDITQAYSILYNGNVAGLPLNYANGFGDTQIAAYVYPISNPETRTYLRVQGTVWIPDGGYNPDKAVNTGTPGWAGAFLADFGQGITERLSFQIAPSIAFYAPADLASPDDNGENPVGKRLTQKPTYQLQPWLNFNISRATLVALGYWGSWGGAQSVNGRSNGAKTQFNRLRLYGLQWLSKSTQVTLELQRDINVVGGFQLKFAAILRFGVVF